MSGTNGKPHKQPVVRRGQRKPVALQHKSNGSRHRSSHERGNKKGALRHLKSLFFGKEIKPKQATAAVILW